MIKLNTSHLRGDIYGGLTAGVVALPLALAMGVASGLGPIAGLYGAIFVGFFCRTIWRNRITDIRPNRTDDRRCRWTRGQYCSAPGSGRQYSPDLYCDYVGRCFPDFHGRIQTWGLHKVSALPGY